MTCIWHGHTHSLQLSRLAMYIYLLISNSLKHNFFLSFPLLWSWSADVMPKYKHNTNLTIYIYVFFKCCRIIKKQIQLENLINAFRIKNKTTTATTSNEERINLFYSVDLIALLIGRGMLAVWSRDARERLYLIALWWWW